MASQIDLFSGTVVEKGSLRATPYAERHDAYGAMVDFMVSDGTLLTVKSNGHHVELFGTHASETGYHSSYQSVERGDRSFFQSGTTVTELHALVERHLNGTTHVAQPAVTRSPNDHEDDETDDLEDEYDDDEWEDGEEYTEEQEESPTPIPQEATQAASERSFTGPKEPYYSDHIEGRALYGAQLASTIARHPTWDAKALDHLIKDHCGVGFEGVATMLHMERQEPGTAMLDALPATFETWLEIKHHAEALYGGRAVTVPWPRTDTSHGKQRTSGGIARWGKDYLLDHLTSISHERVETKASSTLPSDVRQRYEWYRTPLSVDAEFPLSAAAKAYHTIQLTELMNAPSTSAILDRPCTTHALTAWKQYAESVIDTETKAIAGLLPHLPAATSPYRDEAHEAATALVRDHWVQANGLPDPAREGVFREGGRILQERLVETWAQDPWKDPVTGYRMIEKELTERAQTERDRNGVLYAYQKSIDYQFYDALIARRDNPLLTAYHDAAQAQVTRLKVPEGLRIALRAEVAETAFQYERGDYSDTYLHHRAALKTSEHPMLHRYRDLNYMQLDLNAEKTYGIKGIQSVPPAVRAIIREIQKEQGMTPWSEAEILKVDNWHGTGFPKRRTVWEHLERVKGMSERLLAEGHDLDPLLRPSDSHYYSGNHERMHEDVRLCLLGRMTEGTLPPVLRVSSLTLRDLPTQEEVDARLEACKKEANALSSLSSAYDKRLQDEKYAYLVPVLAPRLERLQGGTMSTEGLGATALAGELCNHEEPGNSALNYLMREAMRMAEREGLVREAAAKTTKTSQLDMFGGEGR